MEFGRCKDKLIQMLPQKAVFSYGLLRMGKSATVDYVSGIRDL